MNVIYSNTYYDVVLLDEPLVFDDGALPLHYGVYNKQTEITETYLSYQPGAIQVAQELSDRLEGFIGTPVGFEPEIVA